MEHMFKKFLSLAALLSIGVALADCNDSCNNSCDNDCIDRTHAMSCLLPRSQSKNNVIKTAGLDPDHEYLDEMDCFNWNLGLALEYTQSFNNDDIAACFFGPAIETTSNGTNNNNCGCDDVLIRIKGTGATGGVNGTTNLVAQNFFLPTDFESTVTFSPSIKNINFHIQFYAGLDEWAQGLYFRLYAPVTHTWWNLDANETLVNTDPTGGYAAGAIAPVAVPVSALQPSFLAYMRGNTITIPGAPDITVQGLRFGRIAGCDSLTETKLADLRAELGWNFCMNEDYHFGFYVEAAAPTGNHCCADFLFSPIVGNGHFWELGAGLTAHYTLWRGCDDDKQFDFFIEADVTHLFQHDELRTFDLVGKPLSRYMMAQQLTTTTTGLQIASGDDFVAAPVQFNNVFAPVANITTQNVDVSIAAHGEVLAKFVYTCGGFSWELGYDFYGRSCEDVELNCDCPNTAFANNRWALIGDAQVFGFTAATAETPAVPVALGAVRNNATAFSLGTPANPAGSATAPFNTQITNGVAAFNADDIALVGSTAIGATGAISTAGTTSQLFITQDNIDFNSSQTRFISNKVFTHFNYTWIECEDWIPFIGVGASAEFGSNGNSNDCCPTTNVNTVVTTTTNNNCDNDCDSCGTCSISQWAVWIKGGVSFN